MVRLNAKPLKAAQNWFAFYERFWSDNLDALQAHLESTGPSSSAPDTKEK